MLAPDDDVLDLALEFGEQTNEVALELSLRGASVRRYVVEPIAPLSASVGMAGAYALRTGPIGGCPVPASPFSRQHLKRPGNTNLLIGLGRQSASVPDQVSTVPGPM